jgi:hypothetical protein
MKMSRNVMSLMGALLLAGAAFAGTTSSGTLHLEETVTVQGKQLKPGDYRVQWEGTGDTVELNIVYGRKSVATVTARVVPVSEKNESNGHVTRDQNGSTVLTQIFFRGKNYELHLDDAPAMTPVSSGNSSNN